MRGGVYLEPFILTSLWHFVQRQKLLSNWRGVLIDRSYLSSFMQLGREYSAYWISCLAAVIDHSRNSLAAANGCCKILHEQLRYGLLWLKELSLYVTSPANQSSFHGLADSQSDAITLLLNPLMPSGAFNICCPRDCVSRHNGGTRGAHIMPRDVSLSDSKCLNGGHEWVKDYSSGGLGSSIWNNFAGPNVAQFADFVIFKWT